MWDVCYYSDKTNKCPLNRQVFSKEIYPIDSEKRQAILLPLKFVAKSLRKKSIHCIELQGLKSKLAI